jgi:hypothetical protein
MGQLHGEATFAGNYNLEAAIRARIAKGIMVVA